MATKSNELDYGGIDLVVNQLKTATSPGGTQSTISAAELAYLDGASSSTFSASKVMVSDASGYMPYRRVLIPDATTVTLTWANSGCIVPLDLSTGCTITLPAAGTGMWYEFVVKDTGSTGNYKIITASGSVFLVGTIMSIDSDTSNAIAWHTADGTTHRAITMNYTTTGGITGSHFTIYSIGATQWLIKGVNIGSGAVATPFATS